MVAHLFWHDVKQNLKAIRVLPLLALTMYLAYKNAYGNWEVGFDYIPGVLTRRRDWLFEVIPLIAGLMGASLANERRKGIALTILARGVSHGQYLRSKMLGAAASAALFTLIAIGGFYAFAVISWLPEHETFRVVHGINLHGLPVENLVVSDVLCALMLMTAPAALSLVGVLAGLLLANEYVAMVSPPIFTILLAVLMRHIFRPLSPERYLSLWYMYSVPPELIFFAPFLYWGGMSLLIAALCKRIIAQKELA